MLSVALYFVETEEMLVPPLQASMTTYIANGTNEFTSKWNSVQSQASANTAHTQVHNDSILEVTSETTYIWGLHMEPRGP